MHELRRLAARDDRLAREQALLAYFKAHPISGGAPDEDEHLTPDLPEDVSALSDDDVARLLDECLAVCRAIHEGDESVVGELSTDEVVAEMERAVQAVEALRGVQTERAEAAAATQQTLDELAARALTDDAGEESGDGEGDGQGDGDGEGEGAGEETPKQAVAAAAKPRRRALPARARQNAPEPRRDGPGVRTTITAAADIPGVSAGAELPDLHAISRAMLSKRRSFGQTADGNREEVVVASLHTEYPAERQLTTAFDENHVKLQSVVGESAIVAAGGLCAPLTPLYDLPVFGITDRPVRDMLPSFEATRGGILFMPPPDFTEITTGIGTITAAEDAAGGAGATKTCQEVTCPATAEVDIEMTYRCLQFRNLPARTFPERVEQFTQNALIAHAQWAEVRLLDKLKAGSTLVTAASPSDGGTPAHVLGAVGTFFGHVAALAAATRNRLRMDPETRMRFLGPAWLLDALQVDGLRKAFHDQGIPDDASFINAFRALGVEPSFYMDGPTGAGQMWASQGAGALLGFPPVADWFLWPEGTWVYLDGGQLDLGLVRDSALNAVNAYQVFGESFESVAKTGIVSYNVRSSICANGSTGGAVQLACPAV